MRSAAGLRAEQPAAPHAPLAPGRDSGHARETGGVTLCACARLSWAQIEHRCASVASALPLAERGAICAMFVDLASYMRKFAKDGSMKDYIKLHERRDKRAAPVSNFAGR